MYTLCGSKDKGIKHGYIKYLVTVTSIVISSNHAKVKQEYFHCMRKVIYQGLSANRGMEHAMALALGSSCLMGLYRNLVILLICSNFID